MGGPQVDKKNIIMKNINVLYFIVTLLSFNYAFSQDGEFTIDREQFVADYSRLLASSGSKEVTAFIDLELRPILLEGTAFPEDRFQQMAKTVNILLDKRHSAYPHTYKSEEHTSELQSRPHLVCRLLLEKKKKNQN